MFFVSDHLIVISYNSNIYIYIILYTKVFSLSIDVLFFWVQIVTTSQFPQEELARRRVRDDAHGRAAGGVGKLKLIMESLEEVLEETRDDRGRSEVGYDGYDDFERS